MSTIGHEERSIDDAISAAVRRAMADVGHERLSDRLGGAPIDPDAIVDLTGAEPVVRPPSTTTSTSRSTVPSDPYAVLGVDRGSSWETIVAARNRLVRTLHPDAGGEVDAEGIVRLNAAFAELRIRRGR